MAFIYYIKNLELYKSLKRQLFLNCLLCKKEIFVKRKILLKYNMNNKREYKKYDS